MGDALPEYIVDCDGTIIWEPTADDFDRIRGEELELLNSYTDRSEYVDAYYDS